MGLKPKLLQKNYNELDANFRIYTRSILSLATALHRSKNIKDLFIDLNQISDQFKQNHWSNKDLELFFTAYYQTAVEIDAVRLVEKNYILYDKFNCLFSRTNPTLKANWDKFMKVFTKCLLVMYK